jgi:D-alanine-D-alanine ligase
VRVTVLFDDIANDGHAVADEQAVLESAGAVETALVELGHEACRVGVRQVGVNWVAELTATSPDVVFNLCEGSGGRSAQEAQVAATVELLGLPITGSPGETLALARRKDRMNAVLAAAGLTVPPWTSVPVDGAIPDWTTFPAIVKPAGEDASIGITQSSVARDSAELEVAINAARRLGPLLVQAFVPGRELNVGIVGDGVLPISEIDFGGLPDGYWPILSYPAKWDTNSIEDRGTQPRCPAPISKNLANQVACTAAEAWRLAEGRGYGRVDLRTDEDGGIWILDVNPNPDLAPNAGLARMAVAAGYGYVGLIDRIVREALA